MIYMHDALFGKYAHSLVFERIFTVNKDRSIHSPGAVHSRRSARQQFHTFNVEFSQPDEIAYKKIQPRGLVVHSVNQLIYAAAATSIKSSGTDRFEIQARGCDINPF